LEVNIVRKLLAVAVFILYLSLSTAFAGHSVVGNGVYCECGTYGCVEDYPGECGGNRTMSQQNAPSDIGSESLLILVAIMLWLRLKA
jgi:hypothetical protein